LNKKLIGFLLIKILIISSCSITFAKTNVILELDDLEWQVENTGSNLLSSHKIINNVSIFSQKNSLKGNDEGPHQNMFFEMKEWWYYNVFFNNRSSELQNWFLLFSLRLYPEVCGFKLELFDDRNKSYGGDKYLHIDDIQVHGPGVNVFFNNSFMVGKYPFWHIYAEYIQPNNIEIVVNLTFIANSLPVWILMNTGLNNVYSFFGYYCLLNCSVEGTISLNGTRYNVNGLGYHDHTWAPINIKKPNYIRYENRNNLIEKNEIDLLKMWNWLCVHFDNGWDMFVGKIYLDKSNDFSKYVPGNLCFTQSGKEFYDVKFFILEYEKTINSSIPQFEIPTKVHIKALLLNIARSKLFNGLILLDFYYETNNTREVIYGDPPSFGYWVSLGDIYGSVLCYGKTIPLSGRAVMETTDEINPVIDKIFL